MAVPATTALYYGVIARYQDADNFYFAYLSPTGVGAIKPGVSLFKRVAGVDTQLGSTIGATQIATNAWYRLFLLAQTAAIRVRVQRQSDGQWMTGIGAWSSSPSNTISSVDATFTGASRAGIIAAAGALMPNGLWSDDFVFEGDANTPEQFTPVDTIQLPRAFTNKPISEPYGLGL